jgi:hypothetical protein
LTVKEKKKKCLPCSFQTRTAKKKINRYCCWASHHLYRDHLLRNWKELNGRTCNKANWRAHNHTEFKGGSNGPLDSKRRLVLYAYMQWISIRKNQLRGAAARLLVHRLSSYLHCWRPCVVHRLTCHPAKGWKDERRDWTQRKHLDSRNKTEARLFT